MSVPGSADAITDLISAEYPHFRQPHCEVVPQEGQDGVAQYRAKIRLFDQVLITSSSFPTESEAESAAIQQAKDALQEFIALQLSNLPENIKQVISHADKAMKQFDSGDKSSISSSFPTVEVVDSLGAGNEPVTIVRITEENFNADNAAAVEDKDPLIFLNQMASKTRLPEPKYTCFEQLYKHGCQLSFNGANVTVPAAFNSKSDAKRAAAKLLCEELYADYPSVKFFGPTVSDVNVIKPEPVKETSIDHSKDTVKQDPPNKSAMSELNLWCQRAAVPMPQFLFDESESTKGTFVCSISAFGYAVKSGVFTKKSAAKEEAARLFLQQASHQSTKESLNRNKSNQKANSNLSTSDAANDVAMAGNEVKKPRNASHSSLKTPPNAPSINTPPDTQYPQTPTQRATLPLPFQNGQQPTLSVPQLPAASYSQPQVPIMPQQQMFGNPYMGIPQLWPNPYYMHMMGFYGQNALPMQPPSQNGQPISAFPGIINHPHQQAPILPPGSLLMMPPHHHPNHQPSMMMPGPPFILPPPPPPHHPYNMYSQPPPNPPNQRPPPKDRRSGDAKKT